MVFGLALGLTFLATQPDPAHGFVRTTTTTGLPLYWNNTRMTMVIHVQAPPPSLSETDARRAVQAAAAAWSRQAVSCTSLELQTITTGDTEAPVGADGVNHVAFRRDSWCRVPAGTGCYDPSALALTTTFSRKSSGRIIDADTEINAVAFTWADLTSGKSVPGAAHDLQNTLTHEFGHFIGLDHTCFLPGRPQPVDDQGRLVPQCELASREIRETTMFAQVSEGDVSRRTLADDDVRALCSVYPAVDDSLEAGVGCAVVGTPHSAQTGSWVILLIPLFGAARPIRGRAPRPTSRR